MTDEPGVDEGDALAGRGGGQQPPRLGRARRAAYVESQRPQVAFERRSGYRRPGEDCGRQTNSLLGTDQGGMCGDSARTSGRPHVGRGYRMTGRLSSPAVYAADATVWQGRIRAMIIIIDRLAPHKPHPRGLLTVCPQDLE
ncbi:hypothetical protein [Streptomyces sp. NPDC088725]|uniref:hypothetical protein n=1 Tax=Streptomyces sp. NPDC088725 TaxID=3365873 RepID=UPI0038026C97